MTKSMQRLAVVVFALVGSAGLADKASGQEPMIGEIRMFAGKFAPRGWAHCDGQTLGINQHAALFSVIGDHYGGDGRVTFRLPDFRGRAPIHRGQGDGLSNRTLGASAGTEKTEFRRADKKAAAPATNPGQGVETPDLSRPLDNTPPVLTVNFIIAIEGRFPSRN